MTGISRRSILARGGLVAGAATTVFGWQAGRAEAAQRRLTRLHVSNLRILGPSKSAAVADVRILTGSVHLEVDGPVIGALHATSSVIAVPDLFDPGLGFLETQLLTLPLGTIAGIGTVHHDGTGRFTITGSSGRYAGMGGAYTSSQFADHSGFGAATFSFETENPWPALT